MFLLDVNVLVYAHRQDAENHAAYLGWLRSLLEGEASFGLSDTVLSGFLRVVTHPKVFKQPSTLSAALSFANQVRSRPGAVMVSPGARHWTIFSRLCRETRAMGNLISDAHLAAMAIENGAELVTTDRDFERFRGLRSRHPLNERK